MIVRTQFKASMGFAHTRINMPLSQGKNLHNTKPSQEVCEEAIRIALQLTKSGDKQYKLLDASIAILLSPDDFNEYLSVMIDYDIDELMTSAEVIEKMIYAIAIEFV